MTIGYKGIVSGLVLSICSFPFLLYCSTNSTIYRVHTSLIFCSFLLWSEKEYPAVLVMKCISTVISIHLSLFIGCDYLPYGNVGLANDFKFVLLCA
jgi:hypothetical protein